MNLSNLDGVNVEVRCRDKGAPFDAVVKTFEDGLAVYVDDGSEEEPKYVFSRREARILADSIYHVLNSTE